MAIDPPSKAERQRLRREIVLLLEELPRQFAALESAMAVFGDDFELAPFKAAFDSREDMAAYNRAQALERGVGRVQNFIADLATAGVRLAELPPGPGAPGRSPAQRAFESLRDARVIRPTTCRRLIRAQRARSIIEHGYVQVSAGDVHRAAELVHEVAREFLGPFREWVHPYLAG